MSWERDPNGFPEPFIFSSYSAETSFWDRFDGDAKESAAAKWLLELARASERHTILDGWGSLKIRDAFYRDAPYGLECIDDVTRLDLNRLTSGCERSESPRIIHVQLNLDTGKATFARRAQVSDEARQRHWQMLQRLIDPLHIEPDFILGHFLPALASDPPISWQGKPLLFIPPVPSRQRYIRLKKHDGTQMSIMFRAMPEDRLDLGDGFSHWVHAHTVILILEDCLTSPAEHDSCILPTKPSGDVDGFGCIKPYADHVIQSFIQDVQALAIQLLDADGLTELERQATDARERLLYCKRNLIDNRRWLPDLSFALELVDDLRNEISLKKYRQTQDLQLKSAVESDSNAKAANQLAERAGKLGVLAFIFIPLSFVTSLFFMNITPLSKTVPLWHFLAVALPFELLAVLLFFGTVTWGSLKRGNIRAKRAMSWRLSEAKQSAQTV